MDDLVGRAIVPLQTVDKDTEVLILKEDDLVIPTVQVEVLKDLRCSP